MIQPEYNDLNTMASLTPARFLPVIGHGQRLSITPDVASWMFRVGKHFLHDGEESIDCDDYDNMGH
jgi:hypothetical protein